MKPKIAIRTRTGRATLSLVVLALLGFALQSVVFSGASFTSASSDPGSVFTAGVLRHTNSRDGQIVVDAGGIMPGDVRTGSLTITGSGDLSGVYTLSKASIADSPASPGLSNTLTLLIEDTTGATQTLFSGTVAAFATADLGTIAPGAARQYRFTIEYPVASADPALRGASMSLQMGFKGVQN